MLLALEVDFVILSANVAEHVKLRVFWKNPAFPPPILMWKLLRIIWIC